MSLPMLNMTRSSGKMTLTFNQDKYKELLLQYQPKLIRTEEKNEKALALVEELMHHEHRSPEENELYELLIFLIERFEQAYYVPRTSTPHSLLLFLLEQQGITKTDLGEALNSIEIAAELVDEKREISQEQAKVLGRLFHVDSSLFL
jgi:HTH-type transcriptional regulator / antitoxin HigA